MKYNDYELISMVRENDESSYDTLFQKYTPIIKKLASNYYHLYENFGCDYEDFLQEAYISFQTAVRTYDESKDALFYTFVVLCVKRGLLTFCRKFQADKSNCNYDNFVEYDDLFLEDYSCDVEREVMFSEIIKEIWSIVYDFPFEYICVFELKINNFNYREIESLIGISVRKAQGMVSKIYGKIHKSLKLTM